MKLHAVFIDSIFCIMPILLFLMFLGNMYASESPEVTLPAVNLSQTEKDQNNGFTSENFIIITLAKGKGKKIDIFVKDKRIDPADFDKAIKKEKPGEVILRVDMAVTHGKVMEIIKRCKQSGIRSVSFACKETG